MYCLAIPIEILKLNVSNKMNILLLILLKTKIYLINNVKIIDIKKMMKN